MRTTHDTEQGRKNDADTVVMTIGAVALYQRMRDGRFDVTYGKQARRGMVYADAARELGECLMHQAACDGKLDNEEA